MDIEQPIVGLGEIAKFLNVSRRKVRMIMARAKPPLLEAYKPTIAVLPSDLLEALKMRNSKRAHESTK